MHDFAIKVLGISEDFSAPYVQDVYSIVLAYGAIFFYLFSDDFRTNGIKIPPYIATGKICKGVTLMQQKIPLDEQETIISLFPAQISTKAEIYTCMPAMVNRMKKLAAKRPDAVRILKEDEISLTVEVDRSCIKISPKRLVSDEQRRQAAERFAAAREKKVVT